MGMRVVVALLVVGILILFIVLYKTHMIVKMNDLNNKMGLMLSQKIDEQKLRGALCLGDGSEKICEECKYRGVNYERVEDSSMCILAPKGYYCKLKCTSNK